MSNTKDEKIKLAYHMDESLCLETLIDIAKERRETVNRIQEQAYQFGSKLRENRLQKSGLDAFLAKYDLSSKEGIALMCLAESLLRVPDKETQDKIIKDKIATLDWEAHLGKSHSWLVNAATWSLLLTGKVLDDKNDTNTLMTAFKRFTTRTAEPVIRLAVLQAMKILGKQFVMSETIEDAIKRAKDLEKKGYRYSYDMLGEAAKTSMDAEIYFQAYSEAIQAVGRDSEGKGPILGPGISIKLSAIHPRYEWVNRKRVMQELLPRLKTLALQAKEANISFCIDAEESDRLEISLVLLEALISDPRLKSWQGLGLAVQSYQKRALFVTDWLIDLAKKQGVPLMVRLVKGAYWDTEIKVSQERGFKDYPVFTRKSYTDVCYLACARKLLEAKAAIFPQFASHNAYTVAAILEMVNHYHRREDFEFQCLHGMGDALYDNIVGPQNLNVPCRIYAPVGNYSTLLAYLVRRLLENGANTSFVNRILDEKYPLESLITDPVQKSEEFNLQSHPAIPLPKNLFKNRPNSEGVDLSDSLEINPLLKEIKSHFESLFKELPQSKEADLEVALETAGQAFETWEKVDYLKRANLLENMAALLDQNRARLMAFLIREGGKTVQDAQSECREAIDYCWYYAAMLKDQFKPRVLQGPTGEYNQLSLEGRGVFLCISPWNFPLAIFLGQITAALAAGNVVIAKAASHTPFIANFAVELLHQAGFPKEVVQLVFSSGTEIGRLMIPDRRIAGVMLTGSTETARMINQTLANREGPILPFVAETGGQNAMIVDSSALPEQVVGDVLTSAFNSAGQRCSALRVLFLQSEIADHIITLLKGAMQELTLGDPFLLSTDIGPVIDSSAKKDLLKHVEKMNKEAQLLYTCALPEDLPDLPRGVFFEPRMYEIDSLERLTQEVFGPILHVIRYQTSDLDKVLKSINKTGYGLTLGIHSRISSTINYISQNLRVGNIYVNRNMIGAVVGVQPFGGEGLSGTGPKAGGPHILPRLATERTLSVNIAATGGNVELLSLGEGG